MIESGNPRGDRSIENESSPDRSRPINRAYARLRYRAIVSRDTRVAGRLSCQSRSRLPYQFSRPSEIAIRARASHPRTPRLASRVASRVALRRRLSLFILPLVLICLHLFFPSSFPLLFSSLPSPSGARELKISDLPNADMRRGIDRVSSRLAASGIGRARVPGLRDSLESGTLHARCVVTIRGRNCC